MNIVETIHGAGRDIVDGLIDGVRFVHGMRHFDGKTKSNTHVMGAYVGMGAAVVTYFANPYLLTIPISSNVLSDIYHRHERRIVGGNGHSV